MHTLTFANVCRSSLCYVWCTLPWLMFWLFIGRLSSLNSGFIRRWKFIHIVVDHCWVGADCFRIVFAFWIPICRLTDSDGINALVESWKIGLDSEESPSIKRVVPGKIQFLNTQWFKETIFYILPYVRMCSMIQNNQNFLLLWTNQRFRGGEYLLPE